MKFPRSVAVLGEFLDLRVELDGRRSTFSLHGTHWLCGEPCGRRVWILPASRKSPQPLEEFDEDLSGTERLYRRWHDLQPIGATPLRVRVKEPAELVGQVNVIGYRSDKWTGDFVDYEHVFRSPPTLARAGEAYRIFGGALRVTAGGIVG